MYSDQQWENDRQRYGWRLPDRPLRIFRMPIIRQIRAKLYDLRSGKEAQRWASGGLSSTYGQGYRNWVRYAITRGKC